MPEISPMAVKDETQVREWLQALEQRRAASETHAAHVNARTPTWDAALAGVKWGIVGTVFTGAAVGALRRAGMLRGTPLCAWIVTTGGMAGFFVASEQAVVGSK